MSTPMYFALTLAVAVVSGLLVPTLEAAAVSKVWVMMIQFQSGVTAGLILGAWWWRARPAATKLH